MTVVDSDPEIHNSGIWIGPEELSPKQIELLRGELGCSAVGRVLTPEDLGLAPSTHNLPHAT